MITSEYKADESSVNLVYDRSNYASEQASWDVREPLPGGAAGAAEHSRAGPC